MDREELIKAIALMITEEQSGDGGITYHEITDDEAKRLGSDILDYVLDQQPRVKVVSELVYAARGVVQDSEDRPGAYIHARGMDRLSVVIKKFG